MLDPTPAPPAPTNLSPFLTMTRQGWARRRADEPLNLTQGELEALRGINSAISMTEVEQIYLPLSRLLNMYVTAAQDLYGQTAAFLGHPAKRVPYVIGLAGSVAAGKSTAARVLQTLLSRWPNSPRVSLVTTDGFLLPNAELERRGLLRRKGFPESYDQRALLRFVSNIKAGAPRVESPVYSHLTYDIVPDACTVIEAPEIVIVEGLNVLQSGSSDAGRLFVSDFFDFSIYVDASPKDLLDWYVERFLKLRDTAFQNEDSYFKRYATLTDAQTLELATSIWREINEPNLVENIAPTRERADLILSKDADHRIGRIELRKL